MKTMKGKSETRKFSGSRVSKSSDEEIDELGFMNESSSSDESYSDEEMNWAKRQLPEGATAGTLSGEPIPMEAHYIWEGGDIPKSALRNILYFKENNPDYNVNIWTSRPMAIENTWVALMDNEGDAIGRQLATKPGMRESINIVSPSELFSKLSKTYSNSEKIKSIVGRENNGPYKNYASASDTMRLAILYCYGGLYMDADVAVGKGLGRVTTDVGAAFHQTHRFVSNAVVASTENSQPIRRLLDSIVSSYYENTSDIPNDFMWMDKRSSRGDLYGRKMLTLYTTGPGLIRDQRAIDPESFGESVNVEDFGHISKNLPPFELKKMYQNRDSLWRRDFIPELEGTGGWTENSKGRRASIG